ncbi:MAG: 2-C-methyl-D-erythritol 4-phosphate cytidylyltransferase [Bacteroidales bacterium]|nr:2-C-methyl-D-erythritol 4-phosphate cytidylyltransferase [Bacteroidales bacterium]
MKNIAVVLAAGAGHRFGGDLPKQFCLLEDRMVIEHSIGLFERSVGIDEVVVVVHPDYMDMMKAVVARRGWQKVRRFVAGGAERYQSSLNAIGALSDCDDEGCNVVLHDAARPWLDEPVLERVLHALADSEAVAVGVPCTDTVWHCSAAPRPLIESIPPRSLMWNAQTPQAFRLALLRRAYDLACRDASFRPTDDCGVILRYCPEAPIRVVEGSPRNRKITFADDLPSFPS